MKSGLEQTAQFGCDSVFGAVTVNSLFNYQINFSDMGFKDDYCDSTY